MHEHSMEAVGRVASQCVENRRTQREGARRSVVSIGRQHGDGVADPPESASTNRQAASPSTHVASVREQSQSELTDHGAARETKPVAQVGCGAGSGSAPVREASGSSVVTGPVSTANVLALLARQDYRCALTGWALTPDTAALDHIVPLRYGGEHRIENTQVLHKDVNRAKNSMTNPEFAQLCDCVAAQWRRRQGARP